MEWEEEGAVVGGESRVLEAEMQMKNMEKITKAFTENTNLLISRGLDRGSYIRRLRGLLQSETLLANCAETALLKGRLHSAIAGQMVGEQEMMSCAREMDRAKCATSHQWLIQTHVWDFERRFDIWLSQGDNVKNNSEELFVYMHSRLRMADELCDSNLRGAIVEYGLCLLVATQLRKNGLFLIDVPPEVLEGNQDLIVEHAQPVNSEFLARLYTSRAQTAFSMWTRVLPDLSEGTTGAQELGFWILVLPNMELRDIEEAINYSGHEDAQVFILAAKIYRFHENLGQALKYAKSARALDPENEEIQSFLAEIRQHDSSPQAAEAQVGRKDSIRDDYLEGTNIRTIETQKQRRQDTLGHREQNKKKQRKTATKSIPKRGQIPQQAQETKCQAEETEKRGHSIDSRQSGTKPKRPSSERENVKKKAKLRDARKTSLKSQVTIGDRYDIKLACQLCCLEDRGFQGPTTDNTWACNPTEHACCEDYFLLRSWSTYQNKWYRVKQCPPKANVSNGICEQKQLGKICKERPCPYPHNEAEEFIWSQNILVEPLMSDLKNSNLRLRSSLKSLTKHQAGVFDFVCKICTSSNPESLAENKKERHRPACGQGHPMNGNSDNELMYFFPEEGTPLLIDYETAEGSASEISARVKDLTSRGFTRKEIIDETKQLRQSEKTTSKNKTLQKLIVGDRHRTLSQSSQGSTHSRRSEAAVPVLNFGDIVDGYEEELEWLSNDLLAHADANDEDEEIDFTSEKATLYYEVYDTDTLYKLLESNPDQFMHCVIHTEGSQQGKCTTLDGQKVIEIRGRMNCGLTFEGDEVLVKIIETPELDKDTKVIRGKVVGVLKRRVNRKAHILVCTVDRFSSNLMIPLCGTCPKIHIRQTYGREKKNNYVDVYQFTTLTKLELRKVVKIDPAKKKQLLFVVKYLKWGPSYIYPLGYVCSVMPAGQDMKTGQKLLNLIHQVPGPHTEKVESYVELQELQYESLFTKQQGREDLTHEVVFSIDPEGCMDVDDALSVSKNADNTYSVGVHIADVSSFVTEGDIVDEDARKRASSFYAAEPSVSYPMLPTRLSHDLCSLLPDKRRCALSVLFLLSADGKLEKPPEIMKTWIRSAGKLSYADAQQCILGQECDTVDKEIGLKIQLLHRLAKAMRRNRLGDACFFVDCSDLANDLVDAHRLVEEFMLLANRAVARFLVEYFGTCTPMRKQDHPRAEDVSKWKQDCIEAAMASFYFEGFPGLLSENCKQDATGGNVLVLSKLAQSVNESVERGNPREVCNLFGAEAFHPLQAIARNRWFGIQNQARFVASGTTEETFHFSLQLKFYTQFTSPIRRYMDIVVHRMVHAGLNDQDNPYTLDDLEMMCSHVNVVYERAKRHSKACDHLRKTCEMMKTPLFLPGIVCGVTDSNLRLLFPHLPHQKGRESELCYSHLDVAVKPDVTDEAVDLTWQKRIYDARGFHPLAKTKVTMHSTVQLNPNANVCRIPAAVWKKLQKAIVSNNREELLNLGSEIAHRSDTQKRFQELTSEMQDGLPIVKHHARFTREFKQGSVVLAQMVAECKKGLIQPTIRLLKFTDEYSMCVQHMKNPVACFADIATNHLKISYPSIEDYQKITVPILLMEAASNCVADSDPIVISNAQISLRLSNGKYYGRLELPQAYCKPRQITLLKNSKDEESDFHDFLCLRCPFSDASGNRLMWVGHAVQTKASTTDKRDIVVEFGIHHMNEPPPEALTNGRTSCHIELLAKTLPDRRMEDAVNELPESSDLCKAIVLGQNPPEPRKDWKTLCPRNLDIGVGSECPPLPKNNERQKLAIKRALTERFTLIQGPPGTGKTITGIKLAYWYCQVNAEQTERTCGPRRQVLYCGPSNSAIDVAAKMLKARLGRKCPKILRVYSGVLQNQVFPIPRDVNVVSKRDRNYQMLGKEDQKAIALHYLIRQKTNSYHAKIRWFDELFRKMIKRPEEVTDQQIVDYQKLVTDASMEEINKYDIVLCTCAVSASPVMVRAANVTQIIIDECGMCMEPESLVPLVAHKAVEQVVLVGDHRQLRPIVKNATARELGLERSLFERFGDNAIMLNEQYRMHNEICAFPSTHFYEGCLISPLKKSFVTPAMLVDRERHDGSRFVQEVNIWPNGKIPLVFCHVEGAEKTLSVSTDEGNEKSKSNEAERDHATRIYRELVNNYKVPSEKVTILTQYKAQCSEIERTLKDYGFETPRVSTVVASQGGEWDYVIMSTVRSMPTYEIDKRPSIGWLNKNLGFITDHHQINVALTRAIKGLIIVGNQNLLKCDGMWSELLKYYRERSCLVPADDFLQQRDRKVYRRNVRRAEYNWISQFK